MAQINFMQTHAVIIEANHSVLFDFAKYTAIPTEPQLYKRIQIIWSLIHSS